MRVRDVTAALAVGLLVLGPSSAAFAQEGEETESPVSEEKVAEEVSAIVGHSVTEAELEEIQGSLSEEEFHCLVEQLGTLEGGGSLSTCEEAPNPILPAPNELIWAVISFTVLLVVLGRFALPAIKKGLEGREEAVRSHLEAAEQAKDEAERNLEDYRRQLADARNEAARIIEEARQAADSMRRDVQESAESESLAVRQRAQGEIDQTVARARADLQREMADFAVRLAERIVERNLDRQAQQALIEQYIAEVGSMSGNGGGASGG